MRISTKGRYALRLMLDLALNDNGDYISIKSIAERQDISTKYLEQIISMLSHAGYVKSVRGSNGGYKLANEPKDYTVGMILRLTEGDLAPVPCAADGGCCDRYQSCVTVSVWEELNQKINEVVDSISLQDLVDKQRANSSNYII